MVLSGLDLRLPALPPLPYPMTLAALCVRAELAHFLLIEWPYDLGGCETASIYYDRIYLP